MNRALARARLCKARSKATLSSTSIPRGEVKAPLVLCGPYLWAQGNSPRKLDGLTWTQNDVRPDQLHPNESGSQKTTTLLMNSFKIHDATSRWFLKPAEKAQAVPLPK